MIVGVFNDFVILASKYGIFAQYGKRGNGKIEWAFKKNISVRDFSNKISKFPFTNVKEIFRKI